MHTFFEAVGLGRIRGAKALERLVRNTIMSFDKRTIFKDEYDIVHGEFSKYYAPDLGVTVCGEFDDSGSFHPEYSFPLYHARTVSMKEWLSIWFSVQLTMLEWYFCRESLPFSL